MKKRMSLFLIIQSMFFLSIAQVSSFEKSNGKETATYGEIVSWYRLLDKKSANIKVTEVGSTDAGYPLQLVLVSNDGKFNPSVWHEQNKVIVLINNGIHPGEPDGIDASMLLLRDIAIGKIAMPKNVVLAIIPVYNIGGCLNRNNTSRVNQNGPSSFGFRGNSQNLDLNRDFTKCDSREARTFATIFHSLQPTIFIDNHVSDGADYQHTMTLITTQYNKLSPVIGPWLRDFFEPAIYDNMKNKGWDMIPYVDFEYSDFNKGMTMFYDPPRYSSGYTSLFNTISFVPETHMLKPYAQRVKSTYDLMIGIIDEANKHATTLIQKRKEADMASITQEKFPLKWEPIDSSNSTILFQGYEKDSTHSEATGLTKMYFDHSKPFTKKIKYFNHYRGVEIIQKPKAYIIPSGWEEVIARLKMNQVTLHQFTCDTNILVTQYHVDDYKSLPKAYEKHHKNYGVKVSVSSGYHHFLKGDYIIYLNQLSDRYLIEMLEPTGDDGFFAWNFFDGILQQKEGYSDYRWEDLAAEVLKTDSSLREKIEQKKATEPGFAGDSEKILDFIYRNSTYYEKSHMTYPVFRME